MAIEGAGEIRIGDATLVLEPGDAAVVPADTEFCVSNPHAEPFRAVVVLPVGGQAVTADGPFTPPWAT